MRSAILASAVFSAAIALAAPALATVVASQSFELPVLNTPGIQYGPDEFSYNTNETGPVVIPGFTFSGFSGIISNTSLGVFPNATDGNQAAFLQGYLGGSSEIDWAITGLTVGQTYKLSFDTAGSFIVPAESFTVSAFGSTPVAFTPTTGVYVTDTLTFTATSSSGSIDFVGPAVGGNAASAIDNLVLSVPEPATWAMMLVGFGAMGAALRSRRRLTIAAA